MPSPKTVLPLLIGCAVGAGGIFQGLHWRSTSSAGGLRALEDQLRIATEENDVLRRENDSLRSLAQGGGELAVPQELVDRIEKEYGLRFKSTPVVHRASADDLKNRIAASYESHFGPGGLDYRQDAYRLIGWLGENDKLLAQLTALRSVGARGWFDDETGEGWVNERFEMENIPDQAALLRIVVRILLHQNFPPPEEYPGDDAARAREALHQGSASTSEARFYAAQARTKGFMPMTDNSESQQLLNNLPPFLQGLTTFPIVDGGSYVDGLRGQGVEKLVEAFGNPPLTTRAILVPGSERAAPADLEMPAVELEPFMTDRAGELGLRLWLAALGDPGVAMEVSAAWENDRYVFFPEDEMTSAVMWDVVLDSEKAADLFEGAALDFVAATARIENGVAVGVVAETPAKRFLKVSRVGPNRVRFLNAAKKETAETLR